MKKLTDNIIIDIISDQKYKNIDDFSKEEIEKKLIFLTKSYRITYKDSYYQQINEIIISGFSKKHNLNIVVKIWNNYINDYWEYDEGLNFSNPPNINFNECKKMHINEIMQKLKNIGPNFAYGKVNYFKLLNKKWKKIDNHYTLI